MHSQVLLKKHVIICVGEGRGGGCCELLTTGGSGRIILCVAMSSGHSTLFQNENQVI